MYKFGETYLAIGFGNKNNSVNILNWKRETEPLEHELFKPMYFIVANNGHKLIQAFHSALHNPCPGFPWPAQSII